MAPSHGETLTADVLATHVLSISMHDHRSGSELMQRGAGCPCFLTRRTPAINCGSDIRLFLLRYSLGRFCGVKGRAKILDPPFSSSQRVLHRCHRSAALDALNCPNGTANRLHAILASRSHRGIERRTGRGGDSPGQTLEG
eukprot:scaffold2538_cov235-Pinguiococcus_pyrenoidosus.AAC.2